MASISDKVKQRLKQHVGSTNPEKIVEHFDEDEAIEDDPMGAKKMLRDFDKNRIDLSGIQRVTDEIARNYNKSKQISDKDLLAKGDDANATLTREEMDRLDHLGGDAKYMNLPFDGSDGKPKSITRKVKAVTVKEGKKAPVTIEKEEEVVPYLNSGSGYTGKKVPVSNDEFRRLQMSKMDSGEARGSGSGLFNIGPVEVGVGKEAAKDTGKLATKDAVKEEGKRVFNLPPHSKAKVFEGEVVERAGLPVKLGREQVGHRTMDAETITSKLRGRMQDRIGSGATKHLTESAIPEGQKSLMGGADKALPRFSGKSIEEIDAAIIRVSSEYSKAVKSGDREAIKGLRFKLQRLKTLRGE